MTTSFQDDFHREEERQAIEALGTTDAKIEEYLEAVLRAAGSSLRHYMPYSKDALRNAMINVLRNHQKSSTPKPLEVAA